MDHKPPKRRVSRFVECRAECRLPDPSRLQSPLSIVTVWSFIYLAGGLYTPSAADAIVQAELRLMLHWATMSPSSVVRFWQMIWASADENIFVCKVLRVGRVSVATRGLVYLCWE
jgi:hypothetical protein